MHECMCVCVCRYRHKEKGKISFLPPQSIEIKVMQQGEKKSSDLLVKEKNPHAINNKLDCLMM